MARNGSGTYVLPEAAFVPNTAISSAAVNSDFSDIADALTGSLARDGQGGMTAVLPMANAGFTYSTDPNTGMRRTGADTQAISCGAIDVVTATSTGISITGTLAVSGAFTVGGSPLLLIGEIREWTGTAAPAKWVLANGQTLLRASYPDLWTFAAAEIALGNTLYTNGNGTTTFTVPDRTGRVGAGREAVATRLTATYFGGNSTILGATGGLEDHQLTQAQHASYALSFVQPTFTTDANKVTATTNITYGGGSGPINVVSATTGASVSAGTPVSANSGGSNSPHNNVQPTIITNFIIYAGA